MQPELTRKSTVNSAIAELMKSMVFRDQFSGLYIVQWFGLAIDNTALATFSQLKSSPIYFFQFIEKHQISKVLRLASLDINGDYLKYMLLLRDIWRDVSQVNLFNEIGSFLCLKYNPDFDFEQDFVTMLESYFYETVYVILIGTLLTYMLCFSVQDARELLTLFGKLEICDVMYEKLQDDFVKVTKIFNELTRVDHATPEETNDSFTFGDDNEDDTRRIDKRPTFIRTNPNSADTRAYFEVAEKVRKALEDKLERMREQNMKLVEELEEKKRLLKMKENEVVRLTFSNRDLFQRTLSFNSSSDTLLQEEKEKELIELRLELEIARRKIQEMNREMEDLRDENLKLTQLKLASETNAVIKSSPLVALNLGSKVFDHDDFDNINSSQGLSRGNGLALEERKLRLGVQKSLMEVEVKLFQANMKIAELEARKIYKSRSLPTQGSSLKEGASELEYILARLNISQFFDQMYSVVKEVLNVSEYTYTTPKIFLSPSFEKVGTSFGFSDKSAAITETMSQILKDYEQISKEIAASLYWRSHEAETKFKKKKDELQQVSAEFVETCHELEIYKKELVLNAIEKSPQIQEMISLMSGETSSAKSVMEGMIKSVIVLEKEVKVLKKLKLRINSEVLRLKRTHDDELDCLYAAMESYILVKEAN